MLLNITSAYPDMDDLRDIKISFGDESVILSGDVYPKATRGLIAASVVFKPINAYFQVLDLASSKMIFEAYKEAEQTINFILDANARTGALIAITAKIYKALSLDSLDYWVKFKSGINLPPDLALTAYEGAAQERTYLEDDYWPLISLSLALRPMIPIWNAYIPTMKDIYGNVFKEYRALQLLRNTWIIYSPAYDRLMIFLSFTFNEQTITKKEIDFSPLISGISTESLPTYLMGLALIRRLAIGDLYPVKSSDSLIANIYNYIFKNAVPGTERNFAGRIHEKINKERGNDEDNTSFVENYKVKTRIPAAVVVLQDISAERPYDTINNVDSSVPRHIVEECLRFVRPMEHGELLDHYLPFAQWTLATAIAPDSLPDLSKGSQILTFAVTQALLWHWGFYTLAVLMTAVPQVMDDESINIGETRARISDSIREQLVELYPHYYPVGGSNPPSPEKQCRQNNVAIKAVEEMARLINFSHWTSTAPPELEELAGIPKGLRRFTTPPDIRNQLAELIIKINTL